MFKYSYYHTTFHYI